MNLDHYGIIRLQQPTHACKSDVTLENGNSHCTISFRRLSAIVLAVPSGTSKFCRYSIVGPSLFRYRTYTVKPQYNAPRYKADRL